MNPLTRRARRLALAPDTWERHAIIATMVGEPSTILDVGGVAGELDLFLPGAKVTSLNVEGPADVHFDGGKMPFEDDSFDAAVSLDVLEHIPSEGRLLHLREMRRVARGPMVICCPLGTPEHVVAEHELALWHRELTGEPHRFLEEHLQTGLPSEQELRLLAEQAGLDVELRFQGNFHRVNSLFRLSAEAKAKRRPGAMLKYATARVGVKRDAVTTSESRPETNRVFLLATP